MRQAFLLALCLLCTACFNHSIAFQELDYTIAEPQRDAELAVVLDDDVAREVRIKSAMTGIAHNWNARPVEMLRQVSDIEFPQMFSKYEIVSEPATGGGETRRIDLWLSVPTYTFADMHATIMVRALAKSPDGTELFDNTYTGSGPSQGGKMFWGGAFAMKSAIRQSSLTALQAVFTQLRADLAQHL